MATAKVQAFYDQLAISRAIFDRGSGGYDQYAHLDDPTFKAAETEINKQIATVERIAAEFEVGLAHRIRLKSNYGWEHYDKVDACEELLARLNSLEEDEAIFGIKGPLLSAVLMHPWVWGVASSLWSDGYRREAVQAAATAIFDSHLPSKLGVAKGTQPRDLLNAFSTDPPTATQPRFRLPGQLPGDKNWTSAHDGAKFLGFACSAGIRNLTTHSIDQPDEQIALEALAALSLFLVV